jgi:hypothetical protein
MAEDIKRITRFPRHADRMVKADFAKTLVAAMDDLGIEPGEDFVIAAYQDELKPDEGDGPSVPEQVQQLQARRVEEGRTALFLIYDFMRGQIDEPELLREMRHNYRHLIDADLTAADCADIGIGQAPHIPATN